MSEAENGGDERLEGGNRLTGGIPPGWARIWLGTALLAVAGVLLASLAGAGGPEADGGGVLLFLIIVAGFFGTVHLLIGCVMQGMALHERTKIPAERS